MEVNRYFAQPTTGVTKTIVQLQGLPSSSYPNRGPPGSSVVGSLGSKGKTQGPSNDQADDILHSSTPTTPMANLAWWKHKADPGLIPDLKELTVKGDPVG